LAANWPLCIALVSPPVISRKRRLNLSLKYSH
jgi:hypothetical protein